MFAPHYAAPMLRMISSSVPLRAGSKSDSETLAQLAGGDSFEVLELAGDHAWGVAPGQKLVGYVPASILERPAA
ncbi:SH3 domain-containing protein [Sphingomonas kyeonggiensis]|uniref:SH3 domain-containing protein n=1 Tax=Sphingomonas kyeonggiensis TaxID=1268553 RepID=UPI0027D86C1D|nr:SH3 domain-containing protein [Sphingomonas kyeonggiensis]